MVGPLVGVLIVLLLGLVLFAYLRGAGRRGPVTATGDIHYLALGDSYTIGTALSPAKSFPPRLARHLEAATGKKVGVVNLGVNGYTTEDLIRDELPHLHDAHWDIVTVLIGVNDFVQGRSEAEYRDSLRRIYAQLAALGLPHGRVVAVSVPDFSYTPAGSGFGPPAQIEAGIQRFNAVAREEADRASLTFVDIFVTSRSRIGANGWVAGDGLHPGEAQLQAWADRVWAEAGTALSPR
ncbi:MAG: SGNH/GDSL hydrolase family protein [Candidatus Dormibacteraeota bacterium]|nr:SGNH/GDSL hydrolase family protein [Candidatus Dormibacteraeota bacterium]